MSGLDRRFQPRKRPVQQRSEQTVRFVVEAAAQVFTDVGYDRATTNAIAERAGVSIGSLYQYFPNKDALLVALAQDHLQQASAAMDALVSRHTQAGTSGDVVIGELVELMAGLNQPSALHRLLWRHTPRTTEIRSNYDALIRSITEHVDAALTATAPSSATRRLSAHVVVTAVAGALHEPAPATGHAEITNELRTLCLRYLRP